MLPSASSVLRSAIRAISHFSYQPCCPKSSLLNRCSLGSLFTFAARRTDKSLWAPLKDISFKCSQPSKTPRPKMLALIAPSNFTVFRLLHFEKHQSDKLSILSGRNTFLIDLHPRKAFFPTVSMSVLSEISRTEPMSSYPTMDFSFSSYLSTKASVRNSIYYSPLIIADKR